ncbi:MAG: lysophospholipid acyltransferase family protein [Gemmatimonadota bacterium]|jgi:lauroyl/myristoyl acyltransferase|nr:hypothetical protein [Gemmatimonadota bacterium]MDP6528639.1 lysophospholipid acyltransferase family protein [Gemmatimonadota bacterium]MDP6803560.1 lysophospholipid acyltransferase family protein [Gemmatimonadota bacterium]MDP7032035.1 lysophospholipid acyltransferase family protein [Gemmatimonadota bacterium]
MIIVNRWAPAVLAPLLFGVTRGTVRKRVHTSLYLAMTNLGRKASATGVDHMVARNFRSLFTDRLHSLVLLLPHWTFRRIVQRSVPPQGAPALEAALAKGKGAIVFSCHMGPYALIPAILSTLFYKVTAVDKLSYLVRPTALAKVEKSNAAYGEDRLETLPVGDGLLLRKLERRLHEGRVVFMMGDYRGTPARGAEPIRFLGHPVHAGRGLAWLHARTGAPLIPAIFTFEKGKPRLEVGEEVNVEGLRTPRDITQRIYKTLEQRILKSPERWALWIDYHLMVSHETLNAEKENNPQ